jgi:hypothetical protein
MHWVENEKQTVATDGRNFLYALEMPARTPLFRNFVIAMQCNNYILTILWSRVVSEAEQKNSISPFLPWLS